MLLVSLDRRPGSEGEKSGTGVLVEVWRWFWDTGNEIGWEKNAPIAGGRNGDKPGALLVVT